ncbi:MAG: hypothetical protein ABXS93_01095 [Sulfurimonas sp.]
MTKLLLLIFVSVFTLQLSAEDHKKVMNERYNDTIGVLKEIEPLGIVYGFGERKVYLFVDPLCRYSRKFISLVTTNQKMLKKYSYIIFLYSIPRLHSTKVVAGIYSANKPLDTLLDVMLNNKKTSAFLNNETVKKIEEIEYAAQFIGVDKRPYIFIEKKPGD